MITSEIVPTPTLPLNGREVDLDMLLPLQGGGWEGDGCPLEAYQWFHASN